MNKNMRMIKELLKVGVVVRDYQETPDRLKGQRFVFTGSLSMGREEAKEKVVKLGGGVSNTVSKDTWLVIGNNPGSKLKKAESLGIKIMNEEEFNKI